MTVSRVWVVANVAKEFGMSPQAAAHEIDNDASGLALRCVEALTYSSAKAQYDAYDGDRKKLKSWKDSKVMDTVEINEFYRLKDKREHARHRRLGEVLDDCRLCQG